MPNLAPISRGTIGLKHLTEELKQWIRRHAGEAEAAVQRVLGSVTFNPVDGYLAWWDAGALRGAEVGSGLELVDVGGIRTLRTTGGVTGLAVSLDLWGTAQHSGSLVWTDVGLSVGQQYTVMRSALDGDECDMDMITGSAIATSATEIAVYWNANPGPVTNPLAEPIHLVLIPFGL